MKLIITVVGHVVQELNRKVYTSDVTKKLIEIIHKNDGVLSPLYFDSPNPDLQKYFVVETSSEQSSHNVINELLNSGAVNSAYEKPKDEPPR